MEASSQTVPLKDGGRSQWFWAVISIGAILCGGLVFFVLTTLGENTAEPQKEPSAPLVKTTSVQFYGETYAIQGNGFLEPVDQVNIIPEVAGKLAYVSPQLVPGAQLVKGDILVRLDQTSFQAKTAKAEANVSMAAANLQQAHADFNRKSDLFAVGGVPEAQLELAAAQLATRNAQLEQARADLKIAKDNLDKTELRAPFDAIVDSERASVGDFVASSLTIATLLDRRTAEISVGLPRREAHAIMRSRREGQGVTVKVSVNGLDGPALTGQLVEVQRSLDRDSRTVLLTVHVDDPFSGAYGDAFFYGTYVDVVFEGAMAPQTLFAFDNGAVNGSDTVWRVSSSNTLEKITVVPVKVMSDQLLATGPLKAGDQLVMTGMPEAADGMKIRLENTKDQKRNPQSNIAMTSDQTGQPER